MNECANERMDKCITSPWLFFVDAVPPIQKERRNEESPVHICWNIGEMSKQVINAPTPVITNVQDFACSMSFKDADNGCMLGTWKIVSPAKFKESFLHVTPIFL